MLMDNALKKGFVRFCGLQHMILSLIAGVDSKTPWIASLTFQSILHIKKQKNEKLRETLSLDTVGISKKDGVVSCMMGQKSFLLKKIVPKRSKMLESKNK